MEDSLPGINVVKLTPILVSPSASPSARFSLGSTRERKGSGYPEVERGETLAGSSAGGLSGIGPLYHEVPDAAQMPPHIASWKSGVLGSACARRVPQARPPAARRTTVAIHMFSTLFSISETKLVRARMSSVR